MFVTDALFGLIADIGLEAAKKRVKTIQNDKQARKILEDYIARQQKYNIECSKEEEIDFQGLAEYIRGNLMDDVESRLFGTKTERGRARQTIADKAACYAKAKAGLSADRARHLAVASVDILNSFYRDKAGRDLLLVAAEVEDTIISEMEDQHREIVNKIDVVEKKLEDSSLLSIDRNLMLADEGNLDVVENNLSAFFTALNSKHDLKPYYGFAMEGQNRLKSIPLRPDAVELYPPRFEVTATAFKMAGTPLQRLDSNTFYRAYRSQAHIEFDIVTAKKYLGEVLDPIQNEAEELSGKHMVMKPPAFPAAFPCSVIVDGETIVDYLLLRTKKIEDDGIVVITNEEQENFNFKVILMVNVENASLNIITTPVNPSNEEAFKYRLFLKKAMFAKSIALKSLRHNVIIISSKANLTPHECDNLDSEIEFLKKVVAIEKYFRSTLTIPGEITVDDHRVINRLYSMITAGEHYGTCSRFTMSFELSTELRNAISTLGERVCRFTCHVDEEVDLFGQKLCFTILKKFDGLRLENFEKVKAKLEVLEDGDILKLAFVSGTDDLDARYSDMFYSEEIEKQLFQSSVSETENELRE